MSRSNRFTVRAALLVGVVIVAVPLGRFACSGPSAAVTDEDPVSNLKWAGFPSTDNLEIVALSNADALDRQVRFVLRGLPKDVDLALDRAGYTASPQPGIHVSMPPIQGQDPTTLKDAVSASQKGKDATGQPIVRQYVRGHADAITDMLHVFVFTT
jgi:hypothetical protein